MSGFADLARARVPVEFRSCLFVCTTNPGEFALGGVTLSLSFRAGAEFE